MKRLLTRPITWLAAAVAAVAGLAAVVLSQPATASGALSMVSVHDMAAGLADGALVLDVREPFEYADAHVAGTVLVPLATVAERSGEFAKDEPVFVFCRSGNRSLVAAEALVAAGFSDVRNVEGGIVAWHAAGLPLVR
jgi:rhodanese-related sulfurtransferase